MAFKIDSIEEYGTIDFDLPGGVTLSLPPIDCIDPAVVKKLSEVKITNQADSIRLFLEPFAKTKEQKDAIKGLVFRQLKTIDKIWTEESGISLGESKPSADTSTTSEG